MGTFQERLLEGMKVRGMSATDLVERSGLKKSAISHYMNGRYEPKQKPVHALAKALNVNVTWLMGYDEPMERSAEEKEQDYRIESCLCEQIQYCFGKNTLDAMNLFLQLSKEDQLKAIGFMNGLKASSEEEGLMNRNGG